MAPDQERLEDFLSELRLWRLLQTNLLQEQVWYFIKNTISPQFLAVFVIEDFHIPIFFTANFCVSIVTRVCRGENVAKFRLPMSSWKRFMSMLATVYTNSQNRHFRDDAEMRISKSVLSHKNHDMVLLYTISFYLIVFIYWSQLCLIHMFFVITF